MVDVAPHHGGELPSEKEFWRGSERPPSTFTFRQWIRAGVQAVLAPKARLEVTRHKTNPNPMPAIPRRSEHWNRITLPRAQLLPTCRLQKE